MWVVFFSVPGEVSFFEVEERGSHHFVVSWGPPSEPNGILMGYTIGHRPGERPFRAPERDLPCCNMGT